MDLVAQLQLVVARGVPPGVQVWQLDLDTQRGRLQALRTQLGAEEQERCARYRQPTDQLRYAATHAALRHLLADRLDIPARHIAFSFNAFGKPRLASADGPFFNLSYAGNFALIALSADQPVGVDIEALTDKPSIVDLPRLFTPGEQQYCSQHPHATLQIWSGKEAVLKAWGTGLGEHFQSASVVPAAAGRYAVSLSTAAPRTEAWQLPAPTGFVAALALSAAVPRDTTNQTHILFR